MLRSKTSGKHCALIFITMCVCFCGNSAHGTSLWYDGFSTSPGDYTVGTVQGQSGGTGSFFTGPWGQPSVDNQLIDGTSLTRPDQLNPSIGGSLGDSYVGVTTGRVERLFTQPWAGALSPVGTFYMGFLVNYGSGDTVHHRALEMWEGDAANDANRNLMLGYSEFVGLGTHLSMEVTDSSSGQGVIKTLSENLAFQDDGATHYMVMRFDLSPAPGADQVRVYLDPKGTSEPAVASAMFSAADYISGGLDLQLDRMGGISDFIFSGTPQVAPKMDELRVGTTFADVAGLTSVPEPATMGMLGVSGLALLRRRRLCMK
jgi:hypothetical protein